MPFLIRGGKLPGDAHLEIARLERLLADLRLMVGGSMPSAADLADAPLLDSYEHAARPEPCLVGLCNTHPDLRGPVVVTSGIWIVAEELGWARTLSRFYRLGKPFKADLQ